MAPPPLSDLLDWRVPYDEVLAMISVSLEYAWLSFSLGDRLPPRIGLPSPAAMANGETISATATMLANSQGPLTWRMRWNMGGSLPVGFPFPSQLGHRGQGCGSAAARRTCNASCAGTRRESAGQREDRPGAGHAAQRVAAAPVELQARADDRPVDRARGQHLAGLRHPGDARGDVDGHAADVVADQLALARVQPRAQLDAQAADRLHDRARAAQRVGRRTVEGGQERVADGLDLAPAVALDLAPDRVVVGGEQVAPAAVAQARGMPGRVDDVGEQHGHEPPLQPAGGVAAAGEELLDLAEQRLGVAEHRQAVLAGQLDEPRAGDLLGEV